MEFNDKLKDKEFVQLLDHLERLGFNESNYGSDSKPCMYWHWEDGSGSCNDALCYCEKDGIVIYSGVSSKDKGSFAKIKNIQDANNAYYLFRQAALNNWGNS